jgi:hypothetical protein
MATRPNDELAHEFDDEFGMHELGSHASHHEDELEAALHEDEFGMHESHHEDELGLHEDELESALHEDEFGLHELGLHESHHEDEFGLHEDEAGLHEGEQLFKKFRGLTRGIGGFLKEAAPVLKSVARVAVPMVAGAVGGPLGGILGKVATQALGEDEAGFEDELGSHEAGFEDELGMYELGAHESSHELMAELMAEVAAGAQHEAEAEAMIGAASVTTLSAADRAALRRLLPHLVRGAAVLTRVLRRRRITRPAVRTIPTILRTTVKTIRRQAAAGRPVSRRAAGRIMGSVTRRVLSNPRVCGSVIVRNLKAGRRVRPVSG